MLHQRIWSISRCKVNRHLIVEVGGPDFPQMEPTDQLDAPNRRLPESRVSRFRSGERPRFPSVLDRPFRHLSALNQEPAGSRRTIVADM